MNGNGNRSPWRGRKLNPADASEAWCTAGHVVHVDEMCKHTRTPSGLGSLCRFHMREQKAARTGGVAHGGRGSQNPNAYSAGAAVAIMLAAGVVCAPDGWVNVDTPFPGVCLECGAATTSTLHNVKQGSGACYVCGRTNANHPGSITWVTLGRNVDDALRPSSVYVMHGADLAGVPFYKVGVASSGERVSAHTRHGLVVMARLHTTKAAAYRAEQAVLDALQEHAYRPDMPDNWAGRTECVSAEADPLRLLLFELRHLVPGADDDDAAEQHVTLAMDAAADEHERLTLKS